MKLTIEVIGMGYIGLPTALLLAEAGHNVYGVDINEEKIGSLQKGNLPFEEKGLKELFSKVKSFGHFSVSSNLKPADVFLIAVPTPQIDHKSDLQYVFSALTKIKEVFKDGGTIIIESTVGPTDCERQIIPEIIKMGKKFRFACCPERAIPGNTLYEMVYNARIIGGHTLEDAVYVRDIYATFIKGEIFTTSSTVASTCKVMENTYRDVNIALANEFARIADEVGFNVWEAISLANKHPRVNILQPGPGVGGHCIPIDPWFFTAISKQTDMILISRKINDNMPQYIVDRVSKLLSKLSLKKPTIGILGYAYKKNVDDFRETPAEEITFLLSKKYKVLINDPFVKNSPRRTIDLDDILNQSDALILVTDHEIYRKIDFTKYPNIKFIFDTRNFFQKNDFNNSPILLYCLGKG